MVHAQYIEPYLRGGIARCPPPVRLRASGQWCSGKVLFMGTLEAETPKASREYGEWGGGFPLPNRLGGLGSVVSSLRPGRKRISVLSKRHRMPLVEMFVVLSEDVLLMEKH